MSKLNSPFCLALCALFWGSWLVNCNDHQTCQTAQDCDDNSFCTDDRCRLGVCSYLTIPSCCAADQDCQDSSRAHCLSEVNRCVECEIDEHCQSPEVCEQESYTCAIPPGGFSCTQNSDCASNWCLSEIDTAIPGGLCGEPCQNGDDCDSLVCLDFTGQGATCLPPCLTDGDCREDQICFLFDPSHGVCFPHCTDASHCPDLGVCNPWLGFCFGDFPAELNGGPCLIDDDCKGWCHKEIDTKAPGGICTSFCSPERPACPIVEDACVVTLSPFFQVSSGCLPRYNPLDGCREYYQPMVAYDVVAEEALAVCQPACIGAACQTGVCNEYSGLCDEVPGALAEFGEPCITHDDCQGLCMNFWPNGFCTGPCDLASPNCPSGNVCLDLGIQTSCMPECQIDDDCRLDEGYLCNQQYLGCVMP